MQLLKVTLNPTGTQILLNRSNILSVRNSAYGTQIRQTMEKLPWYVQETYEEIVAQEEYYSGIIIPLTIRNTFNEVEIVSVNVDTISKVVDGFEDGTCFMFFNNRNVRYQVLSTLDEIATLANSITSGGVPPPVPPGTSSILSALLVNVNVVAGDNQITHNMNASTCSVFVKFADTWQPWAWDDIPGNLAQIILHFDEPAVVQIRILLTTR